MLKIIMMCAILDGPFEGEIPCTPYKDMASCRSAEAGLAIEVVQTSNCDTMERLIENSHYWTQAPIKAPVPKPNPRRG